MSKVKVKSREENQDNPVTIRRGASEDIPQIREWLIESWVIHAENEPQFLSEDRMRTSDVDGYCNKCFDSPDCFILVAEKEGELAGVVKADIQKIQSFFREEEILYIDDLYVREDSRNKGIAGLLLDEAERIAEERRIKWLKARVYNWNEPTQSLLKSHDWHSLYSEWFKVLDE